MERIVNFSNFSVLGLYWGITLGGSPHAMATISFMEQDLLLALSSLILKSVFFLHQATF